MACNYLTGLVLFSLAGGAIWAWGGEIPAALLNPLLFFILLEPVRGIWLAIIPAATGNEE